MSQDLIDRDDARRRIDDLEAQLAEREAALVEGDAAVAERDAEIARLRRRLSVEGIPVPRLRPSHGVRARGLLVAVAVGGAAIAASLVAPLVPSKVAAAPVRAPIVEPPSALADPTAGTGVGPEAARVSPEGRPGESAREANRAAPPGGPAQDAFELELRAGMKLLLTGQTAEAIEVLGSARKERPSSAEANHLLGRALLEQGAHLAEAIRYLELATTLDGGRADYPYYLGRAAGQAAQPAKAKAALERAVSLAEAPGEARPPWLFEAHRLLGRAYEKLGDAPKALDAYRRYLELAPRDDARRGEAEKALTGYPPRP
jgi:hypothetical protein